MADHVKIMNIIASHEQSVSTGTDHYHTVDVSTINSKITQARNELGFDNTYSLSYLALQVITHISSSSPTVKLHCYIGNNSGTGDGNTNIGTKTTDIPNSSTTYTWDLLGYRSGDTMGTSAGKYVIPYWDNAWVFKISIYCKVDVVVGFDNPYTVTINAGEGGTVTGAGKYRKGSTATITATANTGYTFAGWANQNGVITTTANPYSFTVNSNTTFSAVFEKKKYTISTSSSPPSGGSVEGAGQYEYGTSISLEAIPAEGYIFVKWLDGNMQNPRSVTVSSDVTYTALFELNKINKIYIGTSQPKTIYIGTQEVKEVYIGTTKIYG